MQFVKVDLWFWSMLAMQWTESLPITQNHTKSAPLSTLTLIQLKTQISKTFLTRDGHYLHSYQFSALKTTSNEAQLSLMPVTTGRCSGCVPVLWPTVFSPRCPRVSGVNTHMRCTGQAGGNTAGWCCLCWPVTLTARLLQTGHWRWNEMDITQCQMEKMTWGNWTLNNSTVCSFSMHSIPPSFHAS